MEEGSYGSWVSGSAEEIALGDVVTEDKRLVDEVYGSGFGIAGLP
jgi:hypothetical protein